MVDKKISVSEQVANLKTKSALLYLHILPHLDDAGVLAGSARVIKGLCVPMRDDINAVEVGEAMSEMVILKLAKIITIENQDYYWFPTFWKYQTLKKDRQPIVSFPFKCEEKPHQSWEKLFNFFKEITGLEDIGIQEEDDGNQLDTEDKIRKDKRREDRIVENKDIYGEFSKVFLTKDEYKKLVEKLGENNTKILITELDTGIASKGYKYKSHYATILNWANRKITDHKRQLTAKGKAII
jgi:hypothetical protein